MSITSLWRQFLSREKPRQGEAGRRFLERYDTKLHFRELEPRVVLAADVVFNTGTNELTISMTESGDSVMLASDGNDLLFSGTDENTDPITFEYFIDATSYGDDYAAFTAAFNADYSLADVHLVSISDEMGVSSNFTFGADLTGIGGVDGLAVNVTDIENVVFDGSLDANGTDGLDLNYTNAVTGNSTVTFTANADVDVTNTLLVDSSAEDYGVSLTSNVDSAVSAGTLSLNQSGDADPVTIDLSQGTHHLANFEVVASTNSTVSIDNDTHALNLMGSGTLDSLTVTTEGNITLDAAADLEVSDAANLTGNEITLTGDMSVAGNLTMTAAGDISQNGDSVLEVTGTTTINATGIDVTLTGENNDFIGAVSVTGSEVKVTGANSILLGSITAADLEVTATTGTISSTADSVISATGYAIFSAGGSITLGDNSDNLFVQSLEVTGKASFIAGTVISVGEGTETTTQFGTLHFDAGGAATITQTTGNTVLVGDSEAGSLVLTSTGTITQSGGKLEVINAATFSAAGQNITLTETDNDFSGVVNANGAEVKLTDANSILLGSITAADLEITATTGAISSNADSVISASGYATFTAGSSITLGDNSDNNFVQSLVVTGTTSFNAGTVISVGEGTETTTQFGSLHFDAGGAATITQTSGNTALTGESEADSLTLTSTGTITQNDGKLVVTNAATFTAAGQNITLTESDNDFSGEVNATGAEVKVTDANSIELGSITATDLEITATTGAISSSADSVISATGYATFTAGSSITLGDNSDDMIVQSLVVTGKASFIAGTVLSVGEGTETTTQFGSLHFDAGGAAAITQTSGNTALTGDSAADSLVLTSTGAITQSDGKLEITNAANFISGNAENITLNSSDNEFNGAVSAVGESGAAGVVEIVNGLDLILGDITAHKLTATSAASISQKTGETISVTSDTGTDLDFDGTATFKSALGAAITLGEETNAIEGAVSTIGWDGVDPGIAGVVTIYNSLDLILGKIDAAQLIAESEGDITQTAAGIAVGTTSEFTAADGGSITLDESANAFVGAVSLTNWDGNDPVPGGVVEIVNSTDLVLGTVVVSELQATAAGNITQNGPGIEVGGSATLKTTVPGSTIDLQTAGNTFGTVEVDDDDNNILNFHLRNVNPNAGISASLANRLDDGDMLNVSLLFDNRTTELSLPDISILNDLVIRTKGAISQENDAVLNIGGESSFISGDESNVTLMNDGNVFGDAVHVTAKDGDDDKIAGVVQIENTGNLTLGEIVAHKLEVTASGWIDQTNDGISVTANLGESANFDGTATFKAALNQDVTLGTPVNEFEGAVSVVGWDGTDLGKAGAVVIYNSIDLELSKIYATTLDLTAEAKIWQAEGQAPADGINVSGATTLEVVEIGSTIDLRTAGNTFGSVTVESPDKLLNFHLRNVNPLAAIPTNLAGRLTSGQLGGQMQDVSLLFDNLAGFDLPEIDITGNLAIQSGAEITQSGALIIGETSLFISGDGSNVTLINGGNDFVGSVSVVGAEGTYSGEVALFDQNNLTLGTILATKLDVEATGDLAHAIGAGVDGDQDAKIHVTEDATFTAASIDLVTNLDPSDPEQSLTVGQNANFLANSGNIEVGTGVGEAKFGSLTFYASANVTIHEASSTHLTGVNKAGTLELKSFAVVAPDPVEPGDITDADGTTLEVTADANIVAAGAITLADNNQTYQVTGNARFESTGGDDIQIGVVGGFDLDDYDRGQDVGGATTEFGSLTFSTEGHVTISQDSPVVLANDSEAASLALRSNGSIGNTASANLTVHDLAAFSAVDNIVLGENAGNEIDLRILYATGDNISIVESSDYADDEALLVVDGTKAVGTLALKTGGHLIQVNDFRNGANGSSMIVAEKALLVADGGILLTSVQFGRVAAQSGFSGNTADRSLTLEPTNAFNFATNDISGANGFGGSLSTDAISALLPNNPDHAFASTAPIVGTKFSSGVTEQYSIAITNHGTLVVGKVDDAAGDIGPVDGLITKGDVTGHVFIETKSGGDLSFEGEGGGSEVVNTANAQIFTALAAGNLTIDANARLVSSADISTDILGIIDQIYKFQEQENAGPNPELGPPLGVIDDVSYGPTYIRLIGDPNAANPGTTVFTDSSGGVSPYGQITITTLGVGENQNFVLSIDWHGDGTVTDEFAFTDPLANEVYGHDFNFSFASQNAFTDVLVQAYNDPQINLFQQVSSQSDFQSLNVITDTVRMFFDTIPVIPVTNLFVPPTQTIILLPVQQFFESTIPVVFTVFADEGQAATPIEGVAIQEVDPTDTEVTLGDEIQLGKDFLTVDAVKEYIQGEERFRPGLYRITILYPGADQPEVHFFQKQIRATTIDIFGQTTPQTESPTDPTDGKDADAAGANIAQADRSAEEVWRREYEKWFPQVSVQAVEAQDVPMRDDPMQEEADPELQGIRPPDEDYEHTDLAHVAGLRNWLAEYRQGRISPEFAASGTLVGGALLMAAATRGASAAPNQGETSGQARRRLLEESLASEQEELTSPRISRLRRKIRRIL